jgi:nicotinate phosphoribosyltransferase
MNLGALGVDAYQLTTLLAHAALGRLEHRVALSFFFRKLPPRRNFVVFAGLTQILDSCATTAFAEDDLDWLRAHPALAPARDRGMAAFDALARLRGFEGEIYALPEGTLAFAGPLSTTAGEPFTLARGAPPLSFSTPLLDVRTDMVRAKCIETPWLSRINHASMVASKAARVVLAAGGRPVLEFGQRRTHPAAAIDASYAAWIAGCAATSNVAAEARYGIPARGTMDHFAIQASVRGDQTAEDAESEFFEAFVRLFPAENTLLVDTYDTLAGIERAARAGGSMLHAVRLDSAVTPDLVRRARAALDAHGAPQAKVFVSDGLDEFRVRELAAAGADGFGVGENIVCSPDAPVGIGAVAKLVVNGYGRATMKLASQGGKTTLPGPLQVWRAADHDLLALADEAGPRGAKPLLEPVWRGRTPVGESALPLQERIARARARVAEGLRALPLHLRALETDHGAPWPLVASDALAERTRALATQTGRTGT